MSNVVDSYIQAIKLVEKMGKRVSASSVAKALGKDASAIKRSRPEMAVVFDAINKAEAKRKKRETPVAKEKRIKEEYRAQVQELEILLKSAYAREVMSIERMDELKKENIKLQKELEKNELNKSGINNTSYSSS